MKKVDYPLRRIFAKNVPGKVAGYDNFKSVKVEVDAHMHFIFGNKSPYFAVSTTVYNNFGRGMSYGCQHEIAVKVFPKLKPFIRWHLTGLDGPMHYVPNALFFWDRYRDNEPQLFETYDPLEAFISTVKWGLYGNETDEYLKYLFHSKDVTREQMKDVLNHRFPVMMKCFESDMQQLFGSKEWNEQVLVESAPWRQYKTYCESHGSNAGYFK